MVTCNGCKASIKRSGVVQHCRMSRNLACHRFLKDLLETAKEVADQTDPESLEAYMQELEIGMEMVFLPSLY